MTMAHLVACEGCARHVRASEAACPFCGVAIAATVRESSPKRGPAMRLSRAGLAAFGVSAVVAPMVLAGCAESQQMAVYGGPPPELLDQNAPDGGPRLAPSGAPSATPKPPPPAPQK
jgi:hypothetical protein